MKIWDSVYISPNIGSQTYFDYLTLGHFYVKDPTIIIDITSTKPCFVDHLLIKCNVRINKPFPMKIMKRDWRSYSKANLELECAKIIVVYLCINFVSMHSIFESFWTGISVKGWRRIGQVRRYKKERNVEIVFKNGVYTQ